MSGIIRLAITIAVCIGFGSVGWTQPIPLPPPVIPEGLGVNIHFTDPRPGEMKMLADAGFRWVRMDFAWGATETERGKYDWSAYDRLTAALAPHKIRAIFILDYSNKLYDNDQSPHTDEGRAAFARWAAAAARHFAGRGILWEMYNEPNIGFWRPQPNVQDYIKLALAVGKALRDATPNETYIGPATSGLDFTFLEACFKAGLLDYWSAVSVHPYRQIDPESATDELRRLRLMIAKYAPAGKRIPIISGEWGYSSGWSGMTDEKQGKLLPRELLSNVVNDIPVSIWYDWHDDGTDPKEPEHHFGTVLNPYHEGRDPVYDPKPAYVAMRTLTTQLSGYRFSKRLWTGDSATYLLLFSKGDDVRLAAWARTENARVAIPMAKGRVRAVQRLGVAPSSVDAAGMALSTAPVYLSPEQPDDALLIAAAWDRLPLEVTADGGKPITMPLNLRNPLGRALHVTCRWTTDAGQSTRDVTKTLLAHETQALPITVAVTRSAEPIQLDAWLEIEGLPRIAQRTLILASNPLRTSILPITGSELPVRVENPSGEPFAGTAQLTGPSADVFVDAKAPLDLKAGDTERVIAFRAKPGAAGPYDLGVRLVDSTGVEVAATAPVRFGVVDRFSRFAVNQPPLDYLVAPDGDPNVGQELRLAGGLPRDVPDWMSGLGALRITYKFDPGWKFLRIVPQTAALRKIEGKPKAFGLWIYGDGAGNLPRLRFTDATGQTFQPGADALTWTGWRYVTFPMDRPDAGHWGGANDGVIHYPIHWDSIFLLDSANRAATAGTVYISGPTLIY